MNKTLSVFLLLICYSITTTARPHACLNPHAYSIAEEIPLVLSASDKRNGAQLKPQITITSAKTGAIVPLKVQDGQLVAMVVKGETYFVKAVAEGFYTVEKTIEILTEDPSLAIQMDPQPTAILFLKAVDENDAPIEANFKMKAGDKVYSGKLQKNTPYRLVLENPDKYEIEITADKYQTLTKVESFEVGDPPKKYNLPPFKLEKANAGIKILVVDAEKGLAVQGTKVLIRDLSTNAIVYDKTLAVGQGQVELNAQNKYMISAERAGYTLYQQELKINNNAIRIELQIESYLLLSAFDAKTEKRLPATFKIKNNTTGKSIELVGNADGDFRYLPREKGTYQIEVSMVGYQSASGSVQLENLSGEKITFSKNLEKAADEYVVTVSDNADKNKIIKGIELSIVDEANQAIKTQFNPKSNEWTVLLEKDKTYKITVTANDYQAIRGDVLKKESGKTIPIKLLRIKQDWLFTAVDALTKKPVVAAYKVTRPEQEVLKGTSDANKSFKLEVQPQRLYTMEVSAENYKTATESIAYREAALENELLKTIELHRNFYTFTYKAIDGQSKKVLPNAKIVIQNLTAKEAVLPKSEKDGIYTFDLIPTNTYSIDANAEGFLVGSPEKANFEELVKNNQLDQVIPLFKKMFDQVILTVVEEGTKNKINNPEVKILSKNNEETPVQFNPKTAEWTTQLKNDETYSLQVKAYGFLTYKEQINNQQKFQEIKLKRTLPQEFAFTAIDALTQKPIPASYEVARPEQASIKGTSDATKEFRVKIEVQQMYNMEVKSENYKTVTENILFQKDAPEKEIKKPISMYRNFYTFTYRVIDAETKKIIPNAKLYLQNLTTQEPMTTKVDSKGIFPLDLVITNRYAIGFDAEGYEKASPEKANFEELVKNNQLEQDVPLLKKVSPRMRLSVVEETTKNKIPNAELKVYSSKNEVVQTSPTTNNAEWFLELKEGESYTVEATAKGFSANKEAVNTQVKSQEIVLKRIPTQQNLIIATIDVLTKKPIAAEFSMNAGNEKVNGKLLAGGARYETTISEDKKYEVNIQSKGYLPYKNTLNLQDAKDGVLTVELKKETYTFYFKPIDSVSGQLITNAKFVCHSSTHETVEATYLKATNEFQVDLKPEEKYEINLSANQYLPVLQHLQILELVQSESFKRDVPMEAEKKVPEKVVEVPSKPIEPPLAKAEPKVKYREEAIVVEERPNEKINVEMGQKFRMANVIFEQSSPTLKSSSFPQLDRLVKMLQDNPKLMIEITGFTDNVGDLRINQYLSELRARYIANYLFNKGIKTTRIKYFGKGHEEPVAPNDSEENRSKNRRVEFVFLENGKS